MSSAKPQFENWRRWFATIWQNDERRWAAINGYRAIGVNHPATLTDIALRNNVFAPIRESDPHKAAIAEGRRQCALEIFKLANIDPATLFDRTQVDRKTGEHR